MSLATPSPIDSELRLASEAFRSGDLSGARDRVGRLLSLYPENPEVHLADGILLIHSGDQFSGLKALKTTLELSPNHVVALYCAAFASLNLHQFREAEGFARKATDLEPQNSRAFYLLANSLRAQSRYQEGLHAIDQSLAIRPDDVEAQVTKARLLKDWQLPALAIDIYRQVLSVHPSPQAAVDLAKILLNENHQREALDVLNQVLPNIPEQQQPHALMAQAYTELGNFELASGFWSRAAEFAYDQNSVVEARARAEIAVGRFEVAEQILSVAMERGGPADQLFPVLSTARKMGQEDSKLLTEMDELLRSNSISPGRRANMCFALGKSYDDLKEFDRAMAYFDEANRICLEEYPARRNFDPEAIRRFTDFVISTFTAERIEDLAEFGDPTELPLFVVGMMRSGTTLTESILDGHSLVEGVGEQAFWPERGIELLLNPAGGLLFNYQLAFEFGADYLRQIAPKSPARYVVDKNPANFDLVGLLACVFPASKFVHLKRNAADNLLSIWMTPVSSSVAYASSKENLVFVYRQHLRLLEHFKAVLSVDRFLSVNYEDLTSTPQPTIENMLTFLGLDSEPTCFTPESNRRVVLTPSVHQVRQPIHSNSQARWKSYEPWLGAFADLTSL